VLPPEGFSRAQQRQQALEVLFQSEAVGRQVRDVLNDNVLLSRGPLTPYARALALGVAEKCDELDARIRATSTTWSLERMYAVDRNIVRMALYEALFVDDVDREVAFDEAVELAKRFGTDDSPAYVNGVLGAIARREDAGEDLLAAGAAAADVATEVAAEAAAAEVAVEGAAAALEAELAADAVEAAAEVEAAFEAEPAVVTCEVAPSNPLQE
jgi:N utilization substance protein B